MINSSIQSKAWTLSIVLHGVGKSNAFDDISVELFSEILRQIKLYSTDYGQHAKKGFKYIITCDDGHESDYTTIFPAILSTGVKSIHFISPGFIGKPGYLSWSQISEMSIAGLEFGSHSMTHPKLSTLSVSEIKWELDCSKKLIEDKLGKPISFLSFPYGNYNKVTLDIASEIGYKKCFNSKHGLWDRDSFLIPRNSFNRGMPLNSVENILSPSFFQKNKWVFEDISKKYLKALLGDTFYKAIRDKIY